MRNWNRAFRRASFGGARFWVEEDGPDTGRRVAVHQVSGGDVPIVEDMGKLAVEYSVTAYVVSDLADFEGRLLERACTAPGAALLTLPMDPAQMAFCRGCRRSRSKDRDGYVAYDMTFVEAGGDGLSPSDGLGALRDVFATGLASAALGLAGGFL